MINYIKTVLTKPKEIYTARNMKKSHYFLLLLLSGIALTFLSFLEVLPVANQFVDDYEEIQTSLPAFELVDGRLESTAKSYGYQTDSLVFYFDSENKIDTKIIDSNMPTQAAPISFALLKDRIYFNAAGTSYSFLYKNFENLTAVELTDILNSIGHFTVGTYFLFLTLLFLFNLFLYISQLLPITLFANLISVFRRTRLTFFQNAKIALLTSMGPAILIALLNVFPFQITNQFEIIMTASLFLFYISLTEMKNRLHQQNHLN